jgi:hypothetical protein
MNVLLTGFLEFSWSIFLLLWKEAGIEYKLEPEFLNFLRSPRINSKKSIPPA